MRMSSDDGSPAATRRKRPVQVVISDSEDEDGDSSPPVRKRNGSVARGKRRRRTPSEEDGEQDDLDMLTENENESDGGGVGNASGVHGTQDDDDPGSQVPRGVIYRPEYQRASDGYVSGSIVRIKLINFVTHGHTEFRPGPHLNLILGPNGTGKSSIAAGIAIGLGFHHKTMGRAHELRQYVKQGCENAQTEIELKAKPGKKNPIISRRFSRDSEASQWHLNGSPSTKKDIQELVASFGVQANNLCSFLPQDRVAEFAKMSPEVVLKETMRAAGNPALAGWHEQLIEKDVNRKKLEVTYEAENQEKTQLQASLDRLAPEVDAIQNRQQLEDLMHVLEVEILAARRARLQAEVDEIQAEVKKLRAKLIAAKDKNRPFTELHERMKDREQKANVAVRKCEDEIKDIQVKWKSQMRRFQDAERQSSDVDEKLRSIKNNARMLAQNKQRLQDRLEQAQELLNDPTEDTDERVREINVERREALLKYRQAVEETKQLQAQHKEMSDELNTLQKNINQRSVLQNKLSSIEEQRAMAARYLDPSISFMLDWLKDNEAEQLEQPVGRPPMMSVSIKDPSYAWMIEACTNQRQRSSFICQSKKDYNTLIRMQNMKIGEFIQPLASGGVKKHVNYQLKLNLVLLDERPSDPPVLNPIQLQNLGMDCLAIDQIVADDVVKKYLMDKAFLQNIPITKRPGVDVDIQRVLRAHQRIRTVITGTDVTKAIRSLYGRNEEQTSTIPKFPSKVFGKGVDQEQVKKITDEIADMKRRRADLERPTENKKQEADEVQRNGQRLKKAFENLEGQIEAIKDKRSKREGARNTVASLKKKLAELEAQPTAEKEREQLFKKKYEVMERTLPSLRTYWESNDNAITTASALCEAALRCAQSDVNVSACNEHEERLQASRIHLVTRATELRARKETLNLRERDMFEQARALLEQQSPEVKKLFRERSKDLRAVDVVDQELADVQAQLQLSVQLDPGIVDRYKKLQEKFDAVSKTTEKAERDLKVTKSQINRLLGQFNPALNDLVDLVSKKFSAAFERIGCAGEVRTSRPETGFAHWGIEIMVSYRDGVDLDLLTGSRQSGGERSLATVTYLMSLSEMARTPFSLVDEINQGMDQKAERNVFNQLVEVTCGADAGQYFLITPKLLTELTYHPKMKVLIINNGYWLPDASVKKNKWGDLKSCLQKYKAHHSITAH